MANDAIALAKNMRLYDDELLNIFDEYGKFIEQKLVSEIIDVGVGTLTNCVYECISHDGRFYTTNDDGFDFIINNTVITYVAIPLDQLTHDEFDKDSFEQDFALYENVVYGNRTFLAKFLGLRRPSDVIKNTNKVFGDYFIVCLTHEVYEREIRAKVLKYKPGRKDLKNTASGRRKKSS